MSVDSASDALALVERLKAERPEKLAKALNGKAELLLVRPEQPKALKEKPQKKKPSPVTVEPKDEEALKDEAPVAATDMSTEEQNRRRLIRWQMRQEINRESAVIRSFGGKCVVVTEGRSRDGSKIVYDFQTRDAFEQWKANSFIPSLKRKNENRRSGRGGGGIRSAGNITA
jgi:hypothetical protein